MNLHDRRHELVCTHSKGNEHARKPSVVYERTLYISSSTTMSEPIDHEYDYRAGTTKLIMTPGKTTYPLASLTPTSASARGWEQMNAYRRHDDSYDDQVEVDDEQGGDERGGPPAAPDLKMYPDDQASGVEDTLMDLAQLEEMQQEAERMKALGNKHMAAQVRCIVSRVLSC